MSHTMRIRHSPDVHAAHLALLTPEEREEYHTLICSNMIVGLTRKQEQRLDALEVKMGVRGSPAN